MTVILHDVVLSSRNIAAVAAEISTNNPASQTDSTFGVLAIVLAAFGFSLFLTSRIRKRGTRPRVQTNQDQNVDTYFDRIRNGQDTNGPFGIHPDAYLDDSNPR